MHFAHKDFKRCEIVDKHLRILAPAHAGTRFVKIDVERAPFLVDKLHIRVLPAIISFVNGVETDRLIGFEELGNRDDFPTELLLRRLALGRAVVVKQKRHGKKVHRRRNRFDDGKDDESDDSSSDSD